MKKRMNNCNKINASQKAQNEEKSFEEKAAELEKEFNDAVSGLSLLI